MCGSFTERDGVFHFLCMCTHEGLVQQRATLCDVIKHYLRLEWLSNIALVDVFLLASMLDEPTAIHILSTWDCL